MIALNLHVRHVTTLAGLCTLTLVALRRSAVARRRDPFRRYRPKRAVPGANPGGVRIPPEVVLKQRSRHAANANSFALERLHESDLVRARELRRVATGKHRR
jgi:hypothetical protein